MDKLNLTNLVEQISKDKPYVSPELKKCAHPGCEVMLPKNSRKFCIEHYKPYTKEFQFHTRHYRLHLKEEKEKLILILYYRGKLLDVREYNETLGNNEISK
jgi:hypothetical protein